MTTSLNADGGFGLSGYTDTLAQSFYVDKTIQLTKVDLFFSQKDDVLPVELSIRKIENSSPSANVITNSVVVVDVSNINVTSNASTATTFTFPNPIILESGHYCFALSSDSKKNRVFLGELGADDLVTGSVISKQPYSGVLFMSTNGAIWSTDQTRDLKFKLYRANITSTVATVDLVVSKNTMATPYLTVLSSNPFRTYDRSPVIKVNHKRNGFNNGNYVLYNIAAFLAYRANAQSNVISYNGVPINYIANTYFSVSNVTNDSYTIILNTNAATTANITGGTFGGLGVLASTFLPYTTVYPSVGTVLPPKTSINYNLKTTDAASLTVSDFKPISPDTVDFLDTQALVDSYNSTVSMAGADSFTYRLQLNTNDTYVSPMIELPFASATFITPSINNPSSADNLSSDLITIASSNVKISFSSTGNVSIGGTSEQANVKAMRPGAFVTITNAGDPSNNGTFRLTSVSNDGKYFNIPSANAEAAGNAITIVYRPSFISDLTATGSSTQANYVTKKIDLATPATALLVRFAVSKPAGANIEVYYKLQNGSVSNFNSLEYTQLTLDTIKDNVDGQYVDVEKFIDNLSLFTGFVIKIVLKSTTIARYPKVKDLRVIALA